MTTIHSLHGQNSSPDVRITQYTPAKKTSEWTFLIFPGGAYSMLAEHEGKGYAEFLNANGMQAFVLEYRHFPDVFPAPLSDARNAVRFLRDNAEAFNVNKDKIVVMGSSAGGNLAALLCNYYETVDGEIVISSTDFLPNAQVLCYPVIRVTEDFGHVGSGKNLFGEEYEKMAKSFSLDALVNPKTPPAFLWHTFADQSVSVLNSLSYIQAMYKYSIPCEFHMFPAGVHGLGLADRDDDDISRHVSQWSKLLLNWLQTL